MRQITAPEEHSEFERELPYDAVYCLFCLSRNEAAVVRELREKHELLAFKPVRVKMERRKGYWEKRLLPLLPGYVFVYVKLPFDTGVFYRVSGIIRLLRYENGCEALMGADREFAHWIYRNDGEIGLSKAVLIGDRVTIAEGPLKELEGLIVSVNKNKQIAKVALNICGPQTHIWLSFDWLKA